MRIPSADAAVALEEHEPLRPVAVGVLRGEHAQQQVPHRPGFVQRQQHLGGPLADIARAPAAARKLLQPARRQVVDQRVVAEPGQHVDQARQRGRRRAAGCAAGQGDQGQGGVVLRGTCRFDQVTGDAQAERCGRPAADADKGQQRRPAEQQLGAADRVDICAGQRREQEVAGRESLVEITAGGRGNAHAVGRHADTRCRAIVALLIAAQRRVQARQHTQRHAVQHAQGQAHGMRRAGGRAGHLDQAAGMLVEPAARFRRDLEGRGGAEQLPLPVDLDEQAQAVAAEQA